MPYGQWDEHRNRGNRLCTRRRAAGRAREGEAMSESKSAPTPWRIGKVGSVVAGKSDGLPIPGYLDVEIYGGYLVCERPTKANAERIVTAVNSYDALVEALARS